jgi:hypothetical protein
MRTVDAKLSVDTRDMAFKIFPRGERFGAVGLKHWNGRFAPSLEAPRMSA